MELEGWLREVKFGLVGRLASHELGANPFRRSDKLPAAPLILTLEARLTLRGNCGKAQIMSLAWPEIAQRLS